MASTFSSAVSSWHDFYLAVGSASAALLGLLFVAVSISLAAVDAAQRAELRTRANLAFSNLLYLLCLSLIVLIPESDAPSIAISFTALAGVGLVRNGRRVLRLLRSKGFGRSELATLRRISWTLAADAVLLSVAAVLLQRGDAVALYYVTSAVFVLLVGAADVSWDLLVAESEKRDRAATRERGGSA